MAGHEIVLEPGEQSWLIVLHSLQNLNAAGYLIILNAIVSVLSCIAKILL